MQKGEDKEKLIDSIQEVEKVRLSRCVRFAIFIIFWLIQLFNCSDGGVPSASSNNIKKDLNFTDVDFGQYGSIVQLGRITGTFIVMACLNIFNRKWLLVIALSFKCSSFLIYLVSTNYWIVMAFRYIQGVTHVFPYIYFPTWCDQFGIQKYKTYMLSGIQTASPFGSVFGFSVTTFIGTENWKFGFATLAFCIIPLLFILVCIPDQYFSGKVFFFKHTDGSEEMMLKEQGNKNSIYSIFENGIVKEKKKDQGGWKIWCSLFDGIFLFITLARTVLMFIFMAIHYWLGDYFFNVLDIKDKVAKTSSYSVISLAGPFIGSFIGGTICSWTGGYEKKSSIFVCIGFSLATCIAGAFVSEMTTLLGFSVALFCFFTFANGMMPILIGISFHCVPKQMKSSAYSINSLMCTFLGNWLAPTAYGYLNDSFKSKDKRMAMRIVINYIWINLIYLLITAFFRYRKNDEEEETIPKQRRSHASDVGASMEASTGQNVTPQTEIGVQETKGKVQSQEMQNL